MRRVRYPPGTAANRTARGRPGRGPAPSPAAATLPDPTQPPERAQAPGRAQLHLDRLGDQIAELSARIDAATYELLCHLHEFDRQYGWEGFLSCAQWLNWRTGLSLGAAREKLRVAAALAELNHIPAAMACGKISYSKVRALTRIASPATEARLLAVACGANAAQVERLVRGWRQADREAQADGEQVRLASRMLSTQVDENGMLVLRARLTPEVGAVLLHAVQAALEQVPAAADGAAGAEATIAQRRADALGLVAESALAGGLDPGNPGDRFQVTVHVPVETLASREPVVAPPPVRAATRAASTPDVSAETCEVGSAQAGGRHAVSAAAAGVAGAARSGTPDVSAETCEMSSAQAGGRHAVSATTAGVAGTAASAPPDVSAGTCEVSEGGCAPAAQATDLDAGQAVIEQAGGSIWARRRRAAWPAMPVWWRCATASTAMFSTSVAGRARSPPLCVVPCTTAMMASASSPAATPATATPTTWCTGLTAATPAAQSGASVSLPPSRGARGGLSGDSRRRRRAVPVPAPGRRAAAGAASGGVLAGGAAGADRCAVGGRRSRHRRAYRHPRLVWGVAGPAGGARRAVGTAGGGGARPALMRAAG